MKSNNTGNISKMAHNGRGRLRPLGSVRVNTNSASEKIPKLPAFSASDSKTHKLEIDNHGIHGNAMTVPPQKEKEKREEKVKTQSAKSDSGSSTKSTESVDKKELQEAKAREKDLLKQIAALQKIIEELKEQIKEKDLKIENLENHIQSQEEQYKEQISNEKKQHEMTKSSLQGARNEIDDLNNRIQQLIQEKEQELQKLRKELESKIEEITSAKDKEIKVRDEKLGRLKLQMADALKGNSWERQQQLEELTKELNRLQEESDILRMKLKASKSKGGGCPNCQESTSRLEKYHASMKEKDQSIKELKTLVAKFEKQLTQQDVLLKQWAESKGQKINYNPK